jgi:hypothetical protein
MSSRYLEISVNNSPSDGKMSFRKGIANLIFQVPAMNATLRPASVRVCGKIRFYKDDAANPAKGSAPMAVNERLGVYGAFESLTTRSIKHQQTIENIRHYAHFLNNFIPLGASLDDMNTHMNTTLLTLSNAEAFNDSVTYSGVENDFSLPLPCGLFNGTSDIPLSDTQLGGLEISLALASDSQMIYGVAGDTTGLSDAWYEFSDLKLVVEVTDYSPAEMSQMGNSGVFSYQSITSYYDTINSQQANISFNLGLSKVRSVFSSFIPSQFLNNRKFDSYQTLYPTNKDGSVANISKVVWTKGGALYPKHFEMNNNTRGNKDQLSVDPVVISDYVSAVSPMNKNMRMSVSPINTNRDISSDPTDDDITISTAVPDGGQVWGLGITYDKLGGAGADFTTQNWGLTIDSNLTTDHPHSVFIFVNSEMNVAFNQNGIQVIQ